MLALASTKKVSKLHNLFYQVRHLKGWKFSTFSFFPDFTSVYDSRFEEFIIPSLADFMDEDREEMLLCPIRAFKRYFSRTEHLRPAFSAPFVSTTKRKKRVSYNTIPLLIRSVISHAYKSVTNEDYRTVKVKVHEVWKINISLLFLKNCAIQQVLKAGTWSLQTTFQPSTYKMSPTGL